MAETGKLVNLVFRESLGGLGQWEHQGTRVQWEIRELKDLQEFLVRLDHEETLARMVHLEHPDHLVSLDLLEREEWLGLPGPEVSKECQVRRVKMENQGEMERLVCKVRQE